MEVAANRVRSNELSSKHAPLPAKEMKLEEVLEAAKLHRLRLVRFMYCDTGGIIRGKAVHVRQLHHSILDGVGQSLALQAFASVDRLASVRGLEPVGEFRLIPDLCTFAVLPHVPNSGMMFCDLVSTNKQSWGGCPRTFLKRMILAAEQMGIYVRASFEHEFYLVRESSSGFEPLDRSLCYSSIGFDSSAEFADEVIEALDAAGLVVEQYMPELGPGQQELSIRFSDALRAADNSLLVREIVRKVARKHGVLASFAAKPFIDQAGSGAHIHLSLWDEPTSSSARNLLHDSTSRCGISELGYQFLAGIMAHMPGLVGLTCASPNSYRRLQPRSWSSAYAAYGFDNRECAVRIPSTFWSRAAESTNFEFKPSDHSANPYLALGGLIAAGLDGIRNRLDAGPPMTSDPECLNEDERSRMGIKRLPQTLDEALDALESDQILMESLGPLLSSAYLAVKRLEADFFADKTPEEEAGLHLYKY